MVNFPEGNRVVHDVLLIPLKETLFSASLLDVDFFYIHICISNINNFSLYYTLIYSTLEAPESEESIQRDRT